MSDYVLHHITSTELPEPVRAFLMLILLAASAYTLICIFLFRVPKDQTTRYGYKIIDFSDRKANDRFIEMLLLSVSDFQNRLCGHSSVSLFFRLLIFYMATLTISAAAFDPVQGRIDNSTKFAALAIWITSNVMCDFFSFQVTRAIYNFLAPKSSEKQQTRESDTIILALSKISLCAILALSHQRNSLHWPAYITNVAAIFKARLDNFLNKAREKVALLIVFDVCFSFSLFLLNGYLTNYCYLILVGGNGYGFFVPFDSVLFNNNPVAVTAENFYQNCVINYTHMIENYWSMISSPFKMFGNEFPGMAGITFITIATSVGPASMYFVHRLKLMKAAKWVYPVYLSYLVLVPVNIIAPLVSTMSPEITLLIDHMAIWILLSIVFGKILPRFMEKVNDMYMHRYGCRTPT